MLKSQNEIDIFEKGIQYFNSNQYEMAHSEWETLWKLIGHQPRRTGLKVFLQLTGVYQNIVLGKWDAVRYGIRIAYQRLLENELYLSEWVEVNSIEEFLKKYQEKDISLKAFDELNILKNWGSVHKDLGTE